MELNRAVFREYDIRGVVGKDLDDNFAYALGRAFAGLVQENGGKDITVGWDVRLSSEGFANALARGASDEGISVTMTGMGPTPQLYFSLFQREVGGGIQITGSHNPPEMNGFKICLGKQTLAGPQIQDLYRRMMELSPVPESKNKGTIKTDLIQRTYINDLINNSKSFIGKRKVKIVVDGGNGVGGMVGPEVLKTLGAEVIELYCEPDGRFPNHHPDPTELKNIKDLIAKVKETKADFGIGWDGDADRIGVVDENGNPIFGDMLIVIFGREILKTVPKATFIGDVKCSSKLFEDLKQKGGSPIMWKTGHSLVKAKMKETGAELGGEMSGHIFFKHRFYGFDDALYASSRLLEIMTNTDKKMSELISDLPATISTPEIRVDCPDDVKFKVIEKAQSAFPGYEINTVDGVRITFPKGWGLVRASNTQPVLVMRFEALTEADLKSYEELMKSKIDELMNEF